MSRFEFLVEDLEGGAKSIGVPFEKHDRVLDLIERLDQQGEIDGRAVLELALGSAAVLDETRSLGEFKWPADPIQLQRVCIELHFETESKQKKFPVQAKWARVHRWGCRAFTIANDACAHLELREDTPTGPAINERQEIGPHVGCKTVWLVKPGPEPNG